MMIPLRFKYKGGYQLMLALSKVTPSTVKLTGGEEGAI